MTLHQTLSDGKVTSLYYSIGLFVVRGNLYLQNLVSFEKFFEGSFHFQSIIGDYLFNCSISAENLFPEKGGQVWCIIGSECPPFCCQGKIVSSCNNKLESSAWGHIHDIDIYLGENSGRSRDCDWDLYFASTSDLTWVAGWHMVEHISSEMRPVESGSDSLPSALHSFVS